MELRGTFLGLVEQAPGLRDLDDYAPLELYVDDVEVIDDKTLAIICKHEEDNDSLNCPIDNRFQYVLMLDQVKDVLRVWFEWNARHPTPDEACQAVMYYSENDCYVPAEDLQPGYKFSWRREHPGRGA